MKKYKKVLMISFILAGAFLIASCLYPAPLELITSVENIQASELPGIMIP